MEDDPASSSLLVSHFENEGYSISQADQGDEVLSRIEQEDIDLVLLDIRLPGKDGLTLTRELRALSDIGIILVTAKGDEIDRIVGLELGADDHVTKPFHPRELLVRAKNLLTRGSWGLAAGSATPCRTAAVASRAGCWTPISGCSWHPMAGRSACPRGIQAAAGHDPPFRAGTERVISSWMPSTTEMDPERSFGRCAGGAPATQTPR
ncbi:MAG: response regulator [Halomonas sp.]|uniref:response regulator n=1 Tax=Halomonas sp. TaxID=1486246 RepID=UPI002ACD314D|nr:response regulator [Halomonas sp.]MDZ7854540.1 response regulator [Halomonas sp.]